MKKLLFAYALLLCVSLCACRANANESIPGMSVATTPDATVSTQSTGSEITNDLPAYLDPDEFRNPVYSCPPGLIRYTITDQLDLDSYYGGLVSEWHFDDIACLQTGEPIADIEAGQILCLKVLQENQLIDRYLGFEPTCITYAAKDNVWEFDYNNGWDSVYFVIDGNDSSLIKAVYILRE